MGKLSSRDRKLAHQAGQNVSNIENANFALASTAPVQTYIFGLLPIVPTTGIISLTGIVNLSYVGYTQKTITVDYIEFVQTALAAGAQVGEVGLASTTSAPNGSSKDFTVLAVAGALPDLTTGTVTNGLIRRNTNALAATITPCVHLWAFTRFAMATTQPTLLGVCLDLSMGNIQSVAGHSSPVVVGETLTGGVIPAQSTGATATFPFLRGYVRA